MRRGAGAELTPRPASRPIAGQPRRRRVNEYFRRKLESVRRARRQSLRLASPAGLGAAERRRPAHVSPRQPGEHVDPRGGDVLDRDPGDGSHEQSRHVRSAQAAEQPRRRSSPTSPTSWNWSEDGKTLTFKLREGVKWHDGKPFTAKDVKCTFDLLQGKGQQKLRLNPRGGWYHNLEDVTVNGDSEAVFHLKRPQPALVGAARLGLHADLSVPRRRRRRCGSTRSAPGRSNSSSSSRTSRSRSFATPITGRRTGPISTASNTRSSRTVRPRCSASSPGNST